MESSSSESEEHRKRLIEIVKERSFQDGAEITLASGKTSTFYFNMKPTMLNSEGAYLIASLILDSIEDKPTDLVGGLEMGAVPIASAVTTLAFARGRQLDAFFVRKKAKEHGTRSLLEGLSPGETMAGKNVVIVEDVTTTGGSSIKAAEAIRAEGGNIVQVVTVVDRLDGASEAFAAKQLPFNAILTLQDFKSS